MSPCIPKGWQFGSGSGHTPGLGCGFDPQLVTKRCFSLPSRFLSLPSSLLACAQVRTGKQTANTVLKPRLLYSGNGQPKGLLFQVQVLSGPGVSCGPALNPHSAPPLLLTGNFTVLRDCPQLFLLHPYCSPQTCSGFFQMCPYLKALTLVICPALTLSPMPGCLEPGLYLYCHMLPPHIVTPSVLLSLVCPTTGDSYSLDILTPREHNVKEERQIQS